MTLRKEIVDALYFTSHWYEQKILLSVAYRCNGNQRISRLWNFLLQTHHLHGISRLFDFSSHIIITLHGWIFNHLKFSNVLHSINPIQSNASWLCFPLYFLYLSSVCMYLTGNNKQVGTVVIQILTLFLWFKIEINEQKKEHRKYGSFKNYLKLSIQIRSTKQ